MDEPSFNTRLSDYLVETHNIESTTNYPTSDGKFLDIRCEIDSAIVIIEAKKDVKNKRYAIDDIDKRLNNNYGDLGIALCYPKEYKSKNDLLKGYIHCAVKKNSQDTDTEWETINVTEFPKYLKNAVYDLSSPEELANKVNNEIKIAAQNLTKEQQEYFVRKYKDKSIPQARTNITGLLVDLLTAIMFHARLDDIKHKFKFNSPPPNGLDNCLNQQDVIKAVRTAHQNWLRIDYKQIFEWSCELLDNLPSHKNSQKVIEILINLAKTILRLSYGSHHDLVGITFCQSLENAKFDGSYYTTLPSSILLTNLLFSELDIDWSDYEQIANLRIVDFACGTGTLLIAAAKYILDKQKTDRAEDISKVLLEQILYGFDINNRAIFQSAAGLGMIAPHIFFKRMHLYPMLLGINDAQEVVLGSLSLLDTQPKQMLRNMNNWDKKFYSMQKPLLVKRIDNKATPFEAHEFHLAVMNPPFTANSKRHQHFDSITKKKLQQKEKELFKKFPNEMTSNANGFLVLAEQWLDKKIGRMGVVLPLSTVNGDSAKKTKIHLANKFHIKYLIISHDMKRIYFSGNNTDIGEILVILERYNENNKDSSTKVIKLVKNPDTAKEAMISADSIINNQLDYTDEISKENMLQGDWGAGQFTSNRLYEIAKNVSNFWKSTIGKQIRIKPLPRTVDLFLEKKKIKECDSNKYNSTPCLWNHEVEFCNKLEIKADQYVYPTEETGNVLCNQANYLKFAMQVRLTTNKILACRTSSKSISKRWMGGDILIYLPHNKEDLEKVLVVILNSTFGKLGFLINKCGKTPSYVRFGVENLRNIPIPILSKLDKNQIVNLVDTYNDLAYCKKLKLPLSHKCEIQKRIDESVCYNLNLNLKLCEEARHLLAQEPMIKTN